MPVLTPPKSPASGRACITCFALFWTGFALFWEIGVWASGAPWLMRLFGLPFVAIGVGLLILVFLPTIIGMKAARPVVAVSADRLRPGEEFRLTYDQSFRRDVAINRIVVEFLFRESATYRRGTSSTTVTHDRSVDRFEQPALTAGPGRDLHYERALRVPPDGMHSFTASYNRLQWLIRIHVELAGWPDLKEEYEVQVVPERMA